MRTEQEMLRWAEEALPTEYGQGKTQHESVAFKELAGAVTELAIRDYQQEYKYLKRAGLSHDAIVKELEPEYKDFFMTSPFASSAIYDMDGEDIYISMVVSLKLGEVK